MLGGIFFYNSHQELCNMFWNAVVVMPECRTGSLPLLMDCGGMWCWFYKSCLCWTSLSVLWITDNFTAGCWGMSSFTSLPFQAVPWNSVFQRFFSNSDFLLLEGKPQAAWTLLNAVVLMLLLSLFTQSWTSGTYFYWYSWELYHEVCNLFNTKGADQSAKLI